MVRFETNSQRRNGPLGVSGWLHLFDHRLGFLLLRLPVPLIFGVPYELETGSHVQDSRKKPDEEWRAMQVHHPLGALDHPNTSRYEPEQRNRRFAKARRPGHSES